MNELGLLPFNLNNEHIEQVHLIYTCYSAKTGIGKSEISLTGTGQVKLLEETTMDDPNPQIREGEILVSVVMRVLDLMEEEDFFNLEDFYTPSETPVRTRVIELSLPDRSKKVMLTEPAVCVPFERIAGAIKVAASFVFPDALQYRFFQKF